MGKICSFCQCAYDLPKDGSCGLQPPRGDELCGGKNTFCANASSVKSRLTNTGHYVSPASIKKKKELADKYIEAKKAWDASHPASKKPSTSNRITDPKKPTAPKIPTIRPARVVDDRPGGWRINSRDDFRPRGTGYGGRGIPPRDG